MFELLPKIDFDEEKHLLSLDGTSLESVTKFLSRLEPEFDAVKISYFVAKKELREKLGLKKTETGPEEEVILARAKEIQKEWETKRDDAGAHGTAVHLIPEKFFNEGIVLYPNTEEFLYTLKKEYDSKYSEYKCEVKVGDKELRIGGIIDIPLIRKTKECIIDIEDFKTNKTGITTDSIKWKEGVAKHYNSFMKPPMDHLEVCKFNKFSLQLSVYGYLLERFFNCKIGRLGIRFIDFNSEEEVINGSFFMAVPYLRTDVVRLLAENTQRNKSVTDNW